MIPCRPRGSGHRWTTRLLAAAGLGLVLAALPGLPAQAQDGQFYAQDGEKVIETEWGPLTASDRDLLVRVRYAGLWEIPAGEMAVEKAADERVREIGAFIRDEHIELDAATLEVAAKLGVELPDEPYADNQVALDRMAAAEGGEFDLEFVQRLREAHGQIYPIIAYVRSGTQNDLVRQFADSGEEFVGRHMEYLESTGLVDWVHIPPPPGPAGAPTRFLAAEPGGVHPVLIWVLLGAAAVAGGITFVRTIRPR